MKFSLKKYRPVKALSEETTAYTAQIVNESGEVVGDARNSGKGGADMIHINPLYRGEWNAFVAERGGDEEEVAQHMARDITERKLADKHFKKDALLQFVVAADIEPQIIGEKTFYFATEFRMFRGNREVADAVIARTYPAGTPIRFYERNV